MKDLLLIGNRLPTLIEDRDSFRTEQFTRLLEQCKSYEPFKLAEAHPPTSITFMGMAIRIR